MTSEGSTRRVRRVVFLDLDDTLIPTVWMRTKFQTLKDDSPSARLARVIRLGKPIVLPGLGLQDLGPYYEVRRLVDDESRGELEPVVCEFLRTIARFADKAIIVTNARSAGWLKLVSLLYPDLARTLVEHDIDVLKTKPGAYEPDMLKDPAGYFEYWTGAKLREFQKVLDNETAKCFDCVCIGDNEFEQAAFQRLVDNSRNVYRARMLRCTQGLSPMAFVTQLKSMQTLVASWSVVNPVTVKYLQPSLYSSNGPAIFPLKRTPNSLLTLPSLKKPQRINRYVTLESWQPQSFRAETRKPETTRPEKNKRWVSALFGLKNRRTPAKCVTDSYIETENSSFFDWLESP